MNAGATNRYTKLNVSQSSLWGEEKETVYHQLIEVGYMGGRRETYCTACSYRPSSVRQISAGYVGFPVRPEDCTLCTEEDE